MKFLNETSKALNIATGVRLATGAVVKNHDGVNYETYDKMYYGWYVVSAVGKMQSKDRKSRITASLSEKVVQMVDQRAGRMQVHRSEIIERALLSWLQSQADIEEEEYFSQAAPEMNLDAKDWTAVTSRMVIDGSTRSISEATGSLASTAESNKPKRPPSS